MGQSESKPERRDVPIEQLSHELALRFATKCYSHLEIAHFKDNFKTLADHQDEIEYWKEETLCRFLSLPDAIRVGSVLYAMTTYLGAFPFPSLAPCIVTREAMVKVVTLLTGRYKKVLKRADQDKVKLLFKSLAVFDRRTSQALSPSVTRDFDSSTQKAEPQRVETSATGFSIDQPMNDDEEEDDDDLALAALDALDAIEVFKEDHKQDRKIHHAHVPVYNLERLLMLLLKLAPLTPQDNIALVCGGEDQNVKDLEASARSIIAAFEPENDNISYANFMRTMTVLTPQLFRPLSPLFEHFLFSKQLDLNKQRTIDSQPQDASPTTRSSIYGVEENTSPILTDILIAQLGVSIEIGTTTSSSSSSFFHLGARLNQLYSTASHGTSLSSFSRQVTSWQSATLLVLKGTDQDTSQTHIFGAYLPDHWKEASTSSRNNDTTNNDPTAPKPILFQLSPRQAIFRANPTNHSASSPSTVHFSTRTGIALGCILPPSSRLSAQTPILGPVSLLVDTDMSTATFQHDGDAGTGAFLTDPLLEEAQRSHINNAQAKKITIDIDGLEIWGISFPGAGEDDEITKQKKRLAWEEAEAARRRGVGFGGDKEGARHLLEMAGIIGDSGRSGGSI